jgi:hypothetical protein
VVEVERYVYQRFRGGRVYCPLEHQARIVRGATPRFAGQISPQYVQVNVRAVQTDLAQNHGWSVAASTIQHVAEWVGTIALAKEADWAYALPALDAPIATVVARWIVLADLDLVPVWVPILYASHKTQAALCRIGCQTPYARSRLSRSAGRQKSRRASLKGAEVVGDEGAEVVPELAENQHLVVAQPGDWGSFPRSPPGL